jgi:ABC-type transporter Mla subunit MlaD
MRQVAMAAILALGLGAAVSAQQGFKQTDKVMKRAEAVAKSIVEARQELDKALASYNSVIDGTAKDPRKAYNDAQKQLDNTDKKVADVAKKIDEMDVDAAAYFSEWSNSLASISSADLRKRGEARLTATKGDYDRIKASAAKSNASYQKFVPYFRDQLTFLGHDLNPGAVAGLKKDAAKLNTQSAALSKDADAALTLIDQLTSKLAPQ